MALTVAQAKKDFDYDLIIIGCGVGGHGAALHAVECVSAHQALHLFPGGSKNSSILQRAAFIPLGPNSNSFSPNMKVILHGKLLEVISSPAYHFLLVYKHFM